MENFDLKTKNKILQNIKQDIFPEVNPMTFLPRLLLIHMLATAFVMAICPQFGLGLFSNGHYGLTTLFMQVSHEFCQAACGAFLTLTSGLAIWLPLKITQKEWLYSHKYIFAGIMLSVTSGFFWMRAPDIHLLEFSLWVVGSLIVLTTATQIKPSYSAS
ncbi:hypothetical protein CIK05_07210 [Bdellovibrio sp. qaytius]|nr:hypothetical protein CIK05_07210 [Bdellovibrio sp. qaytius]